MFTELDAPANFVLVPHQGSTHLYSPSLPFPNTIFSPQKRKGKWCHLLKFKIYPPSSLVYLHEDLSCSGPLIEKEIWLLTYSLGDGLPSMRLRGSS